ncbi:short-chain fatty acid transporter [Oleispirillum naphthae]|uniref:short-chain fatty acid transporter n=1 Tax=Oleispirillum naphthae TaxID=2838853 RepID=UPI0030824EB7
MQNTITGELPNTRDLSGIQRFSVGFAKWSHKWIPNSLVFVILLTGVAAILSYALTPSTPWQVVQAWEKGFWDLLAFAMQMCLAMTTGYVVADSPQVKKRLYRIAALPNNAAQAIVMLTSVGCICFWLHWAAGLMGICLLGRAMLVAAAEKGYKLHVPLVAAGTYSCFLVCNGPSFPAALFVATPGHLFEKAIGVIPVTETIFHPINFIQMVVLALLLVFCAWKFIPPDAYTETASPEFLDEIRGLTASNKDAMDAAPASKSPAERLNNSMLMGSLIGLVGCAWIVWALWNKGAGALNLNTINFIFLMLGFVLHGSPARFVAAVGRAIGTVAGVVVQFPLYAGIFGLIKYTGLAEVLVQFFVTISTAKTFPVVAFLYSATLNMFVPSSGSKFIIEAPYILPAAAQLGVNPAVIINAYTVGDCTTNLIQPFWALPVLGLYKVDFKDILPFGFVVCMLAVVVNCIFYGFIW